MQPVCSLGMKWEYVSRSVERGEWPEYFRTSVGGVPWAINAEQNECLSECMWNRVSSLARSSVGRST
jgi:hypothetical protein